jgi:TolB-like protein
MIDAFYRHILARASPICRPYVAHRFVNRLTLFGSFSLDVESGPVTGRATQRHRIALLALLSTTRRRHRRRDQLVSLLWPDTDAERGRKLLSDSIYRVNRACGANAITGCGEDVRLDRDRVWSDVADVEAALYAHDWRRVGALYAGPFLDAFYLPGSFEFDQWMESERAHYERGAAKAFEALAVEARDAERLTEAVEWWQRLATLAPDDSRVAIELMRALEVAGNRAGALRHARAHSSVLRETLGVEPDKEVQALAKQMINRGSSIFSDTATALEFGSAIAVLPFTHVGASETSSAFADGMSEELMYRLARTPALRVASPTSAFAYRAMRLDVREVARRLQVDWILEGSVRRSGDRLRIVAQLTDARNGYQIWSESFEPTSTDDLAVQQEVASAIARRITPERRSGPSRTLPSGVRRDRRSSIHT